MKARHQCIIHMCDGGGAVGIDEAAFSTNLCSRMP